METTPDLSYAAYFSHPVSRAVVRTVERLSGQRTIKSLYDRYRTQLARDTPFWDAAMRLLELDVRYDPARLGQLPPSGPLVVVANHPFGVLDGLTICWLVSLVRQDFLILTNSVLMEAPEARPYLVAIDFAETRQARETNIASRKRALEHLAAGGCIIVFPAGGISTANGPFGAAIDDTWKPFTAKLISASGAHVTPVYFEGQNSRLFQWASHLSLQLRLAFVFREVKRRMGTKIPVHIGETFSPEALQTAGKRAELMAFLRAATYGLAPPDWRRRIARAEARSLRQTEDAA
jgi:putative hemolysin